MQGRRYWFAVASIVAVSCGGREDPESTASSPITLVPSTTGASEDSEAGSGPLPGTTGSTADVTGTDGETGPEPSSSTTGGTGEAEPITPTDSGTGVVFAGGGYRLVISAAGGRITEYSLEGTNALSTSGQFVQQGSTFWVAPQTWGWPPPAPHDADPYTYAIESDEAVFTGGASEGVAFTKRVGMTDDGTVSLEYTLTAQAGAVSWAPWEVTRLAPTLCFFGTGPDAGAFDYGSTAPITPQVQGGVTWVPFEPGNTAQRTLLADAVGWSGCATGPAGLLFLKTFPDIPGTAFSEGNGEVKIWWEGNAFLELEQMGAYGMISAATPVTYAVQWTLTRLSPDVVVEAGSPSLAALLPSG